jgi:hypothetical protein
MMFDLVRWGWPNTAAILALAALPFIALAMPASRAPATATIMSVDARQLATALAEPAAIP